MALIKVRYPDEVDFYVIYPWLEENCQCKWYTGCDWDEWVPGAMNRMVEFENEKDAILFKLKWA